MYIQFHENNNATLYMMPNEWFGKNHNGQTLVKKFNCIDFLEDILQINTATLLHTVVLDTLNYKRTSINRLQNAGIFPKKWLCSLTKIFLHHCLWSHNAEYESIELCNALIYLKQNHFFQKERSPLLEEGKQVYGVLEGDEIPSVVFKTTIELMLYDLLRDRLETYNEMHISKWTLTDFAAFFEAAHALSFDDFCQKYNLLFLKGDNKLQTFYSCISSPKLMHFFKAELSGTLCNMSECRINRIPDYIFATGQIFHRFECAAYLKGLYEKYRIEGYYYVKSRNVVGWLGLITNHVASSSNSFRKCEYCGSYSLIRSEHVCDSCKKIYATEIKAYNDAARARAKNKCDAKTTIEDADILKLYQDVVAAFNDVFHRLFVSILRKDAYEKRIPRFSDDWIDVHPSGKYLLEEFRAQNKAEYDLLEIIPNASGRYGDLKILFKKSFTPDRFKKLLLEDSKELDGQWTLKKLIEVIPPEINLNSLESYQKVEKDIKEGYVN